MLSRMAIGAHTVEINDSEIQGFKEKMPTILIFHKINCQDFENIPTISWKTIKYSIKILKK